MKNSYKHRPTTPPAAKLGFNADGTGHVEPASQGYYPGSFSMSNSLLLRLPAVAGLLLLTARAAEACAVCRPRVQAGIHDDAYAANLLLVLLPVALLLLGGVGLFFAPAIRHRFASHRA